MTAFLFLSDVVQQSDHPEFGVVKLVAAVPGQLDAFFIDRHRLLKGELASLELFDQLLQPVVARLEAHGLNLFCIHNPSDLNPRPRR